MGNTLLAGYSRKDFTPEYEVCISGYGDDEVRRSQGISDHMYITCIAVTGENDTVLLFTSDLLSNHPDAADWIRDRVSPLTGVAPDHIFCGATHSHSAPLLYGDQADTVRFREEYLQAATAAAVDAMADRCESKLYAGTKELPRLNFVRHYLMEDGTYSGSNFGDWKLACVAHATETDPRMMLVRFVRQEKPDILLMNWQAHNDTVRETGYYLLSSGYVHHIRQQFETDTGMHFAFFQGASGNQNKNSRIKEEEHGLNWIAYGQRLAKEAQAMLPDLTPVQGTTIKTCQVMFEAEIDHSWDPMIEQAQEVFDLWKNVGKPEGDALGKTYGFSSSYQTRDIIKRYGLPASEEMELNAFSIGDLGFVTSYNEVFSTVGWHVRANAPFEKVFFITGNCRYLPCAAAYDYRSYESDTGLYAKGTAEKVQVKMVEMLHNVK